MEFKELQQTIVRKDSEILKSKDILVTMEKVKADDEMEWEDHNCQIIYKSEKVSDLAHKVDSQSTLIDSLQTSVTQKSETIAE
jgi:hypothetical protein